jgi:hypothetical protein
MKSKNSVQKSAEASLKTAIKHSNALSTRLELLEASGDVQSEMPRIRQTLSELTQRIHEYNAYRNCLETE